jgi:septal ring factor EnvC (AmiA/AmiB activator)
VAEDVEKVNPDLVVCDKEGKPYSVRYDAVNAMLLNEFLKEHRKVKQQGDKIQKQDATIAQLKKNFQSKLAEQQTQIKALASGLQKVSAQLTAASPSVADLR